MTSDEKKLILQNARSFFRNKIAKNHVKNLKKLSSLSAFDYNPFLLDYLANFYSGNGSAESMARVLVYARTLGTSINTSFGQNFQGFISKVLGAYGSAISGIDIEFFDHTDGRKKYCQIKLGPNTINKDDVKTISDHFGSVKNIARTNNLNIRMTDLVVGVMYGVEKDLSSFYLRLLKEHPIYTGSNFWKRLTGDDTFYDELIAAFGQEAKKINGKKTLEDTIKKLTEDIQSTLLVS